jgi:hypothetical protein
MIDFTIGFSERRRSLVSEYDNDVAMMVTGIGWDIEETARGWLLHF